MKRTELVRTEPGFSLVPEALLKAAQDIGSSNRQGPWSTFQNGAMKALDQYLFLGESYYRSIPSPKLDLAGTWLFPSAHLPRCQHHQLPLVSPAQREARLAGGGAAGLLCPSCQVGNFCSLPPPPGSSHLACITTFFVLSKACFQVRGTGVSLTNQAC